MVFNGFDPCIAGGFFREDADHGEGKDRHEDLPGLRGQEGVAGEFAEAQMKGKIRLDGPAEVLFPRGLIHGLDGLFQAA